MSHYDQKEFEKLKKENSALKNKIKKQQEIINVIDEHVSLDLSFVLNWAAENGYSIARKCFEKVNERSEKIKILEMETKNE